MEEYKRYLKTKIMTAKLIGAASGLAMCLAMMDLTVYYLTGNSTLHPLASLFIAVPAAMLTVLALVSLKTATRYRREITQREQG